MSSDMTLMCRKYLSRKSIFAPEKEYLSRGKRMIFIQTIITLIYSIDAGNERILEFQKRTSVLLDHTI